MRAIVLMWLGLSSCVDNTDTARDAATDAGVDAEAPGVGRWLPMAGSPLEPRFDHAAVWDGTEMIVWGGGQEVNDACYSVFEDGAAYDPIEDSWRLIAQPSEGWTTAAAIWTGEDVIVIGAANGGCDSGDGGQPPPEPIVPWGARYRPATDQWSSISMEGIPDDRSLRYAAAYVWTGSEIFLWSGDEAAPPHEPLGLRYSPGADVWTPIAAEGQPARTMAPVAVWTGSEVLVWGRRADGLCCTASGARYDPQTDSWRPMSLDGGPRGSARTGVWTGSELVVLTTLQEGSPPEAGAYDPEADQWRPVRLQPETVFGSGIWTGAEIVTWGWRNEGEVGGSLYDPAADSWSALSTDGAPRQAVGLMVWTDTDLLVWGGTFGCESAEGGRFRPR